jgi:glyceraldehyde-3-phosphate dehydrogenase (NADP+)
MASFLDEIKTKDYPPIYKFLANGIWQESTTGKTTKILSPVDSSTVGLVQVVSEKEVGRVIKKIKEVQKGWGKIETWKRVDLMHQAARNVEEVKDELVGLLVAEVGKPVSQARGEVERTVELIDYYAEEARRMFGESIWSDSWPGYKKEKFAIVERVPIGVVLAITPFNYPVNETAPKLVAALVTGNSVVLKPSTQGAICALSLAQCFQKAGLPDGVLNVITAPGKDLGDFLVTHPDIAAINFTGGTKTGKHIAEIAAFQKLVMGLSGKDASIVLADADLDLACEEIAKGAFSFAAQRCTAIKKVLVEEKIANAFLRKFAKIVKEKFVLGDPRKVKTTLGPVISDRVADFVKDLLDDALKKGAKLVCGGKRCDLQNGKLVPNQEDGLFFEATILDRVSGEMRIAWEEPFGPVLPVTRVADWQEAIEMANQSEFGLQSSVFTEDVNKAFKVAQELDVGSVQINGKDARGPDHYPFLGTKHSGMGVVQGAKYLLSEMTRIKTTVLNLGDRV